MKILIKQEKYKIIHLPDYGITVSEAVDKIIKLSGNNKIDLIIGQSLGGLISYIVSSKISVTTAIIFSPTPSGSLAKRIPIRYRNILRDDQRKDLDQIKLKPSKAKNLIVIYGGQETKLMQLVPGVINRLNKKARLLILKGGLHRDTYKLHNLLIKQITRNSLISTQKIKINRTPLKKRK